MTTKMRIAVAVITMFFPWPLKRFVLCLLLGYDLSPTAKIGFSIIAGAHVRLGHGARIGHLTMCRYLSRLELGEHARLGNLNWITGAGDNPLPRSNGGGKGEVELLIGNHSAITHRHYIDCSDRVHIGSFTTIAGVRSQILTHSINLESCVQEVKSVVIGNYCFVGTGSMFLQGSRLPNYSVLAAGSVMCDAFSDEWTLYAGVPAKPGKKIDRNSVYFHRTTGFVR